MPIYSYKCQECGTFDVTQRMTEPALTECHTCGNPVKKVFNAPAITGFTPAPKQHKYDPTKSNLWNSAQVA